MNAARVQSCRVRHSLTLTFQHYGRQKSCKKTIREGRIQTCR